MELKINHPELTRVLQATTVQNEKYHRYDLSLIKFYASGIAESTNGIIVSRVYNHHTPFEGEDFWVKIPKKGDIPLNKNKNTIIVEKNFLKWDTKLFSIFFKQKWPVFDNNILPIYKSVPSIFTIVGYQPKIFNTINEINKLVNEPIYWVGEQGKIGEKYKPCLLIHKIKNLMVFCMPLVQEEIKPENSPAWELYQNEFVKHYEKSEDKK